MADLKSMNGFELLQELSQKDYMLYKQVRSVFDGEFIAEYHEVWDDKFKLFDDTLGMLKWLKPTLWMTDCDEDRDAMAEHFAKYDYNIDSTFVMSDIMINVGDIDTEDWDLIRDLFCYISGCYPEDNIISPDVTFWRFNVNAYDFEDFAQKLRYMDAIINAHIENANFLH